MARLSRKQLAVMLPAALDKALEGQAPLVGWHLERLQRSGTITTPEDLIDRLDKEYLAAVAALGAAAGASAAVPVVGTAAGVIVNLAEVGGFLESTVLYVLSLTEIYGLGVLDTERRRALVLAVVLGDSGSATVTRIAERTGKHWARLLVTAVPRDALLHINRVLGKNFVTKFGTKQGILVLGRELPFGLGAMIGAAGNTGIGYLTVRAAHRAFGPAPAQYGGLAGAPEASPT